MRKKRFAVIHFLPIENYPPGMNCLNAVGKEESLDVLAITCKNKTYSNQFECENVKIYRYSYLSNSQKSLFRYLNYVIYNIVTFSVLLFKRPHSILYFDTMSHLPVNWYKKIRPACKIFIHYNEYITPEEYNASSAYVKYLHKKEKSFYSKAHWISQTNEDRLSFFYKDHPQCKPDILHVLPNYPPAEWNNRSKADKGNMEGATVVKLVYVGSLSIDTMFVEAFFAWIKKMNGKVTLDVYSSNYQPKVLTYLKDLDCSFIQFKGAVQYYDLPDVLSQYDIGTIMYKGVSANHVYSEPNKLFEYLSCDLDVWFPTTIKGCYRFITSNTYPKVVAIDFNELYKLDVDAIFNKENLVYKASDFVCEKVLFKLIQQVVSNN